MTVAEFTTKFTLLLRFGPRVCIDEADRENKFKEGLDSDFMDLIVDIEYPTLAAAFNVAVKIK